MGDVVSTYMRQARSHHVDLLWHCDGLEKLSHNSDAHAVSDSPY